MIRTTTLKDFDFKLLYHFEGDFEYDNAQLEAQVARKISVPHTWGVADRQRGYIGKASYSTLFVMEKTYYKTELRFGAVNRFAEVFVNGSLLARHNSGYTPFSVDITSVINLGENTLEVVCSNAYSEETLPYKSAFDWPNDGGILREVTLINYECNTIKKCTVVPEITEYLGNARCKTKISFEIELHKKSNVLLKAELLKLPERERAGYFYGYIDIFEGFELADAAMWSPSSPNLYLFKTYIDGNEQEFRFGIRRADTRGGSVFLNGEPVRLIGAAWMPGSSLTNGMAERKEEIFAHLQRLKDLGCNFTRFPCQQDDWVYDWCDEHGIMAQEEIPFCTLPKAAGDTQYETAKLQAEEMINSHGNHASIVFWGVGNGLNGFSKKTVRYVEHMVRFFKSRDKTRLVNYVSESLSMRPFVRPGFTFRSAATLVGDVCMWNDNGGARTGAALRRVLKICADRALVISAFGVRNAASVEKKKIEIYRKKLAHYRKYKLAGWVYFCLNDYRTHDGENEKGAERRKLCGAVGFDGEEKMSYQFIQLENAKEIFRG